MTSIDRGGLEYTIEVKDSFSNSLTAFREQTEKARDAWKDLRAELRGQADASRTIRQEIEKTTKALDAQQRAQNQAQRTARRRTKTLTEEEQAQRKLEQILKRRRIDERVAQLAAERGVEISRRKVKALTDEEQAQRNVERAQRRLRVQEIQLRLEREKGLGLQQSRIRALREEARAQEEAARAEERRRRTQQVFDLRGGVQGEAARRLQDVQRRQLVDAEFERQAAAAGFETDRARRQREEQERAARAAEREAEAQRRAADAKRRAARDSDTLRQRLARLRREQDGLLQSANRISFTFRRLFGILAAFAAARLFLQFLRDGIAEIFRFNSAIEDAILGIRSLFQASGNFSDAQGNLVEGAEKFALAQKEAQRQVALLRVEGLKTSATFNELLEAYQTALSPGLRAGLSPDQLRGFAVRIAQAAASIGLPGNQLAEEIRSILSGTIQARTTRIAVALGITNEDIRRAREAGELAEFLNARFDAFRLTGEEALGNFSVVIANLRNAISTIIGTAGEGVFRTVLDSLQQLTESLITVTANGIEINPSVLQVARNLLSIFQRLLQIGGRIRQSFTLDDAVRTSAAIARNVNRVLDIVEELGALFFDSFSDTLDIGIELIRRFTDFIGITRDGLFDQSSLRETARLFARIGGIVAGLSVSYLLFVVPLRATIGILGSMLSVLRPITLLFQSIAVTAGATGIAVNATVIALVAVAGAIAFAVAAFRNDFVRSIEISGNTIGELADFIKIELTTAAVAVGERLQSGLRVAVLSFELLMKNVLLFVFDTLTNQIRNLLGLLSGLGLPVDGIIAQVEEVNRKLLGGIRERREEIRRQLDQEDRNLERRLRANRQARERDVTNLFSGSANANRDRRSPEQAARDAIAELKDLLGITEDVDAATVEATAKTVTFFETFSNFGGVVGRTNQGLEASGELLGRLTTNLQRAQDELSFERAAVSFEGPVRNTLELLQRQQTEIRESTRQFRNQENAARAALRQIEGTQGRVTAAILENNNVSREDIRLLQERGAEIAKLSGEISGFETSIRTINRDLRDRVEDLSDAERARFIQNARQFEDEINQRRGRIAIARQEAETLLNGLDLEESQRGQLIERIRELVQAEAQRIGTLRDVETAVAEAGKAEALVRERAIRDLEVLNLQETRRLQNANARLSAENQIFRLQTRGRFFQDVAGEDLPGTQNEAARQLLDLTVETLQLQADTSALERRRDIELATLTAVRDRLRGQDGEAAAQARLTQAAQNFTLELENQQVQLAEIERQIEQQRFILEQPFEAGFTVALQQFAAEAQDVFATTFEVAQNALEGFTTAISESLVDAFTSGNQTILQRFADLGNQIAQTIFSALIRLAILKAILEPLGLGGSTQGDIAAAQAAAVKATSAAALAAASAAQASAAAAAAAAASASGSAGGGDSGLIGSLFGFNTGGSPEDLPRHGSARPRGLHHSDVIPAWLGYGEFVQPARAVAMYGKSFMEALRTGAIDPNIIRSLTGVRGASKIRASAQRGKLGYNTGGLVGRGGSSGGGVRAGDAGLTIVNVFDRNELVAAVADSDGQEVLVNVIRSRREDL